MLINKTRLFLLVNFLLRTNLALIYSKSNKNRSTNNKLINQDYKIFVSGRLQRSTIGYPDFRILSGFHSLDRYSLIKGKSINPFLIKRYHLHPISKTRGFLTLNTFINNIKHSFPYKFYSFVSRPVRLLNHCSISYLDNFSNNKGYFKNHFVDNFNIYSQDELSFDYNQLNNINNKDNNNKLTNMGLKKGKALMSYFKNRQGLKIRTYASEVDKPKGKVFLVHGIKSHFRGDYAGYNVDWHSNNIGEYKNLTAQHLDDLELKMVFPSKYQRLPSKNENENDFSTLDGKDVFDVTPRFKYEGSFVEYLNNLGYSTYGLDHQSHGFSESLTGRRCYFDCFDDVCYDLIQFITLVKKGNFHDTSQTYDASQLFDSSDKDETNFTTSNLYGTGSLTGQKQEDKYYLMGLSMGGNVVLRTMELYALSTNNKKKLVDALVCCAGMINIDYHYVGMVKRCFPFLRFLNRFKPAMKVGEVTNFAETLTMYMRGQDPLVYRDKLCLKMALMIYDATKTLDRDFSHYPKDLPTLFLHSVDDVTCDVKGPRYLMDKYFKGVDHASFYELEGAAHVITSPLYTTVTGPLVQKFFEGLEPK